MAPGAIGVPLAAATGVGTEGLLGMLLGGIEALPPIASAASTAIPATAGLSAAALAAPNLAIPELEGLSQLGLSGLSPLKANPAMFPNGLPEGIMAQGKPDYLRAMLLAQNAQNMFSQPQDSQQTIQHGPRGQSQLAGPPQPQMTSYQMLMARRKLSELLGGG